MEKIWLRSYPRGVPADIDPDRYSSVVDAFHAACRRFRDRPCFTNMGVTLTFGDLERLTGRFAAFLKNELRLEKGDRIAIQMPNVLQYPVALFGALRAGLIVVNTNPLYTYHELARVVSDSRPRAIVVLANFADKVEQVLPGSSIEHVIVTQVADLLPQPRRSIINFAAAKIKKMVP